MAKITLTAEQIQERINKAQAALDKAQATLAKHEAKAAKLLAKIEANGWDVNKKMDYTRYGATPCDDAYWLIGDYEDVLDNIKNKKDQIKAKEHSLEVAKRNYMQAAENDKIIDTVLPECMKGMMKELAAEWTRNDIEKRETIRKEYDAIRAQYTGKWGRDETPREIRDAFRKKWGWDFHNTLGITDEEYAKANEKAARGWTLDLWNRIKEKVGTVTDWSGIYCNGVALNGWVKGDKGETRIETILAGGYNIQRLHVRTILH